MNSGGALGFIFWCVLWLWGVVFFGTNIFGAFTQGEIRIKRMWLYRDSQPIRFWFFTVLYIIIFIAIPFTGFNTVYQSIRPGIR